MRTIGGSEVTCVSPVGVPAPALRAIGAGFGRTGTLSLRQAMHRLGFGPCDHMESNLAQPQRFALWREAAARKHAGQPIDWTPLLDGYRAAVDWPAVYFWRELAAAHPRAKVILTVRDPGRWYDSAEATIFRMHDRVEGSAWAKALLVLVGLARPEMRDGYRVVNDLVWQATFGGRFADREHALRVFREHVREVRHAIPPERLLVFNVEEGWEPLCRFLGVPVPRGEPFPHVNDTASFHRRAQDEAVSHILRLGGASVAGAAGVSALAWIAWRMLRV